MRTTNEIENKILELQEKREKLWQDYECEIEPKKHLIILNDINEIDKLIEMLKWVLKYK